MYVTAYMVAVTLGAMPKPEEKRPATPSSAAVGFLSDFGMSGHM